MPKPLKIIAIAVTGILVLVALVIAIFAASFNPNDYKPQLIHLVAEKYQRTLHIPGEIKLSFYPKLGAQLGQVSLSEQQGKAAFAAVKAAKISLALLPLLRRQLVVDQISVDGLQARLRRNADGSTNFDDLLPDKDEVDNVSDDSVVADLPLEFNISGVALSNADVRVDDLLAKRQLELTNLNLKTGKIANGVPSQMALRADVRSTLPVLAASVALKSDFTFDLTGRHYTLRGADIDVKGKLQDFNDAQVSFIGNAELWPAAKRFALDGVKFSARGKRAAQVLELRMEAPQLALTETTATGGKLSGEAKLIEGPRSIVASFSAPSFSGSPQAFKLPAVVLDLLIKEGKLDAVAKLSGSFSGDIDKLLLQSPQLKLVLSGRQGDTALAGSLSTAFATNLKTQQIDFSTIVAAFTLPNPNGGSLQFNTRGNAHIDLKKSTLRTVLKGKLDESIFDAKFGMPSFKPAVYSFDVDIDQINADRYLKKNTNSKASAAPVAEKSAAKSSAVDGIDLSVLRDLRAKGNVSIGALTIHNLKAQKLRATLHAGDSKLSINPLTANLYGGSASGSLSATASKTPRFTLKQNLREINVGPLLQDAIAKQPIEGRGTVVLDVSSAGAAFEEIKKSLNGSARLDLRNGAVHGVNVAQAIRNAKLKIGELRGQAAAQTGTSSSTEKTDFSELGGSFRITNGVARNDDLQAKSPLIRLGGAGDIDLAAERLDYLAKVTVVPTLQGEGGPELQALKGLTIPLRLSGPFSAISWRIDFSGLVKEVAKEKLEEKKTEIKEKAREQIKDKLKNLFRK